MAVTGIDDLLGEISRAPRGRRTAAFFDFDGTLIDGYSAMAMMEHRARRREVSPQEMARLLAVGLEASVGRADFDRFMRVGVKVFRGRDSSEMDELGERLFRSVLGGSLYPEAWELIAAHKRRGHSVVIASSALPFQIEPMARDLGVDHVLCTRLEAEGGILTGEIDGPILWGDSKATAVDAFASAQGISLERSFAYANGEEDIAFLSLVGRPTAVNPASGLATVADQERWPTVHFQRSGRLAGIGAAIRTVGAFGGLMTGFGAGAALALLNGDRKAGANLMMSVGSELALNIAGIDVRVLGEENLWSQRPAVFIFNHQSWLDGLIVMKLVRQDVTGVAKKEVLKQPGLGQFAKFANMAFLDRGDGKRAKEALAPVVERLGEGYSIAISPEGTRSVTPRLGPFKKGAFHMAMQGGVPIVPIVIRNAGQLFWRGAKVMRAGTIDVVVHPPIATADWNLDNLDARVAEVHDLFDRTLRDWSAATPMAPIAGSRDSTRGRPANGRRPSLSVQRTKAPTR